MSDDFFLQACIRGGAIQSAIRGNPTTPEAFRALVGDVDRAGRFNLIESYAELEGKSRREVADKLLPLWGNEQADRIHFEHHVARTPEPPTRAERAATAEATRLANQTATSEAIADEAQTIRDRAEYTDLRKTNPFAAAAFGEQHPEIYEPGGNNSGGTPAAP